MSCPECGTEITTVGGTILGFTDMRVPIVQGRCANGHVINILLKVIKDMELPRSEKYPPAPGHYQGTKAENIQLCCPICQGNFGLAINNGGPHSLDEETGIITPSMVCPYGCGWHTHISLEEWKEGKIDVEPEED